MQLARTISCSSARRKNSPTSLERTFSQKALEKQRTCFFADPLQFVLPSLEKGRGKKPNKLKIMSTQTPDLTKQPPRSPRVRLGGYVILPRMLDKGRATIAGKNGEYHYACPQDQRFLEFVGIDPEGLKKQLVGGKGDGEILEWIGKNASHKRIASEISAWSALQEQRAPDNPDSREFFNGIHKQAAPKRTDIATWFDVLDVDDYVSFGGKA
jgi:hypothetical protein